MHGGFRLGMGGFGWFFMLLFSVAIIVGIIYLIRSVTGTKEDGKAGSALDILGKRYAKGGINKEEPACRQADLMRRKKTYPELIAGKYIMRLSGRIYG